MLGRVFQALLPYSVTVIFPSMNLNNLNTILMELRLIYLIVHADTIVLVQCTHTASKATSKLKQFNRGPG